MKENHLIVYPLMTLTVSYTYNNEESNVTVVVMSSNIQNEGDKFVSTRVKKMKVLILTTFKRKRLYH